MKNDLALAGERHVRSEKAKDVMIDTRKYYLVQIEEVLGIFQSIIDYYKKELN